VPDRGGRKAGRIGNEQAGFEESKHKNSVVTFNSPER